MDSVVDKIVMAKAEARVYTRLQTCRATVRNALEAFVKRRALSDGPDHADFVEALKPFLYGFTADGLDQTKLFRELVADEAKRIAGRLVEAVTLEEPLA